MSRPGRQCELARRRRCQSRPLPRAAGGRRALSVTLLEGSAGSIVTTPSSLRTSSASLILREQRQHLDVEIRELDVDLKLIGEMGLCPHDRSLSPPVGGRGPPEAQGVITIPPSDSTVN